MNLEECKFVLKHNDKIDDILYCDINTITRSVFTQKEWAEKLGVSEAAISSWISSRKIPAVAERAIQYELLKNLLKQYKDNTCRSMIVEKDGEFQIYDVPEFDLENKKGKLVAKTNDSAIAEFINFRRVILQYLEEYAAMLEDQTLTADQVQLDLLENKLSDLSNLLSLLQKGTMHDERKLEKLQDFEAKFGTETLTEKQKKSLIFRSRRYDEYSRLQVIPDGTKLRILQSRGSNKGEYYAQKIDGCIVGASNRRYTSLSGAAGGEIGCGSWNGWAKWECLLPGGKKWIKAAVLRKRQK